MFIVTIQFSKRTPALVHTCTEDDKTNEKAYEAQSRHRQNLHWHHRWGKHGQRYLRSNPTSIGRNNPTRGRLQSGDNMWTT